MGADSAGDRRGRPEVERRARHVRQLARRDRRRGVIGRYTLPEAAAIWSDEARFDLMLRVELAVLRVLSRRGDVPPEAVAVIEARARVDVARIAEIERTIEQFEARRATGRTRTRRSRE